MSTPSTSDRLKDILSKYGTSLLNEPRRLKALLQDLFADSPREMRLLILTVEEGLVHEFQQGLGKIPHKTLVSGLAKRLHDLHGTEMSLATWAIDIWGSAFADIGVSKFFSLVPDSLTKDPNDQNSELPLSIEISDLINLAVQGNDSAQFELGSRYLYGLGVPQSESEAMTWFRKSAEQGNQSAQIKVGEMFKEGISVPKNDLEAIKWLQLAAAKGNQEAINVLRYSFKGRYKEEFLSEKEKTKIYLAEKGDAIAQYELGWMYDNGLGVEKNSEKALMWYLRSATQGHSGALNLIGFMYEKGQGVSKNIVRAYFCYNLSSMGLYDKKMKIIGAQNRERVGMFMSVDQIDIAQKMSSNWIVGSDLFG